MLVLGLNRSLYTGASQDQTWWPSIQSICVRPLERDVFLTFVFSSPGSTYTLQPRAVYQLHRGSQEPQRTGHSVYIYEGACHTLTTPTFDLTMGLNVSIMLEFVPKVFLWTFDMFLWGDYHAAQCDLIQVVIGTRGFIFRLINLASSHSISSRQQLHVPDWQAEGLVMIPVCIS